MERWNKTTMMWGARDAVIDLETNIPRSKSPGDFHKIDWIEATSLPDREGRLKLSMWSLGLRSKRTKEKIRLRVLEGLKSGIGKEYLYRGQTDKDYFFVGLSEDGMLEVQFFLENGDGFCDAVIEIVRTVFRIFGVEDEYTYALSFFKLKQETFFKFRDAWIPFIDYLKMSHHLHVVPSGCEED